MYYQLHKEQKLNAKISDVWNFAVSPKNLQRITPDKMGFEITSENSEEKIYPGMIITYKVSPILNIKMNWVTEITQVKENKFFIDEQRLGPYKMWHHQHIFIDNDDHVLMKDIVTYIPPFGLLGDIANKLFIKRQLNEIFNYRFVEMNKIFN
ncbi:MAG: hypothetical protein CMD04_03370 [Flavobacteriales bacterium]|nr:hypothetical protein [Flavobacteriales bacterium]